MATDDTPPTAAAPALPLVQTVVAQNSVVAGAVGQINLNIEGTGLDAAELLRLLVSAGPRKGEPPDDDPFAAEIDANRGLMNRYLFTEALEGFRALQQKCGSATGLSKSRFRIANNTGVCLMALGRFDEAVASFNSALSIEPDNDLARVNLAAAHLQGGRPELTLTHLNSPITNVAVRGKAGAHRLAALARLGRFDEVEAFVQREAWTAHDAYVQLALAQVRTYRGDATGVDDALQIAMGSEETAVDAHLLAGMQALGTAGSAAGFVPVRKDVPRDRLERALASFRRALELMPVNLVAPRAALLANCGLVLALLGDEEQAIKLFDESRATAPRPNLSAAVNHAAVLLDRGEFADAARVLRESKLADQHPHVRLQLGAALYASGSHQDVIDLLQQSWRTFPNEADQIRAGAMVLQASRHLGHDDLGREVCRALVTEYAGSWEAWLHVGRYHAAAGERDGALSAMKHALSIAGADDAQEVREALGYQQAACGDHAGSVATLESLDVASLGDGAAQALVVSLYNVGALNRARAAADVLLARDDVPVQVLEVGVAVASQAGDLPRAIDLQRRLVAAAGDRLRDVNGLATFLLRNGDRGGAAEALAPDAWKMEGADDAHHLMVYAHLLNAVGDTRSLEYGYRAWERGRDNPKILLGYVGLFLERDRGHDAGLDLDVVVPGSTVTLSVLGKSTSRVVSIVRDDDAVPDARTWVKPTDPLATRLLGRRVGDAVAGPTNPVGQTFYRVEKVQRTFVRAFQETLAGFNERFPDAEGLWGFEFKEDDPDEMLRVLLAVMGNRGHVNELVARHTQGRLPLAALATALQRSIPVAWSALIHDSDGGLCFSPGADKEAGVASRIVQPHSEPLFLDYSALMTLQLLDADLRRKVVELLGPVRVLQSLLDDLHTHAVQASPKGDGEGMNLSVAEDGRLRGSPLEDTQGFLKRVQAVARDVASPCPAYSQFDAPPAARDVAEKVFGEPTADLLWEAAATGGIILCDDQALAVVARKEYKTATVSVQAVALAGLQTGRLSSAEYSAVVEYLALAKYRFVTVNSDVIKSVLDRHEWKPTDEVRAVFSCLSGPGCNTESAAVVGAHVLREIMLEPRAVLSRASLVDALLARLTTGHDLRRVVGRMLLLLRGLLKLLPLQFEWLHQTLRAWVAARSWVWSDTPVAPTAHCPDEGRGASSA